MTFTPSISTGETPLPSGFCGYPSPPKACCQSIGISVKGAGSEGTPYFHCLSPSTARRLSMAPIWTRTNETARGGAAGDMAFAGDEHLAPMFEFASSSMPFSASSSSAAIFQRSTSETKRARLFEGEGDEHGDDHVRPVVVLERPEEEAQFVGFDRLHVQR